MRLTFDFWQKVLLSICRPPVRLIDKRKVICDHIKYLKKIRLPSQCKVSKKWWSITIKIGWVLIFFHLFRSHCQVGGSVYGRSSSSSTGSTRICQTSYGGTCLTSHGGPESVCCVRVRWDGPTRIFSQYFQSDNR